jgi:tetratricopeptide (TPR) repeat protein
MKRACRRIHFHVFVFLIGVLCILPLPAAAQDNDAEANYKKFIAIYRQEKPTKAELQSALGFLEKANDLSPNTYKYVFGLGALNNTLGRFEEASRWLEKAQSLPSTEQQKQAIQNEIDYCQVQLAKVRASRWSGSEVSISFIMKFGTVEMDKGMIGKLPKRLPSVASSDSPRPIVDSVKNMLRDMRIQTYEKSPFLVVGLQDGVDPKNHYDKGLNDFYNYFKSQYFVATPSIWLVVVISSSPEVLVEATRRMYPEVGIPVHAPFLGYYNPGDNLIMATGGAAGYGTLLHEMIHALMAADFPEAPAWLNEGLASLYERSYWSSSRLNALPNWRMDRMREEEVLSLKSLARKASDVGLHSPEIAEFRLFLLFLDQQEKVDDLYRMAKKKGMAFSLEEGIGELGLTESEWRAFLKTAFRDYKADISRGSGGMSNPEEVKFLQQALNELLGANLKADGLWGPTTQQKLVEFQRKFNLGADGVPGPNTIAELKRQYALARMKALEPSP